MNCESLDPLELANLVNTGGRIFKTSKDQTQSETVTNLNLTTANFAKVDGRYQTADGKARLDTTITTEIGKRYTANYVKTPEDIANGEIRMGAGTYVHALNETILNHLIDSSNDVDTNATIGYLHNTTWQSVSKELVPKMLAITNPAGIIIRNKISDTDRDNLEALFNGAKDVLLQVHNYQRNQNKLLGTNGKAQVFIEQVIVDPSRDMGGTGDMIVIYSDNTAGVFDFKTKMPYKNTLDKDGNLISTEYITWSDKERFKMQLGSIQKILTSQYGVKQVVQSRIVPIQLNVRREEGKLTNTINKIFYGAKQNPFLAQYAPLPELTGFKDLDTFLVGIDKKIKSYEAKIKSDSKNRDYYQTKVNDLNSAKQSVLVKHSFNDLLTYGKHLLDTTDKAKLEELSIERLREIKDELKSLTLLTSATYEYKEALKESSGEKGKEIIANVDASIRELSAGIDARIYEVEQELYNKRVADAVKQLSGYAITDQSGRFIKFNEEGFFGKYTNQLSQFENPVFKAYRALLDKAQYDTREGVKKTIDDVIATDNALRQWMKENGKDEKWLTNSLIDQNADSPDADNLFNTLSPEFRQEVKDAKNQSNVAKLVEIFEPRPSYASWFEQAKKDQKEYYIRKYGEGSIADRNYTNWIEKNDLSLNAKGEPNYTKAWLNTRSRLSYKKAVIEANYSKEYNYIRSIPPLLAYYNMFEKYNTQFRKMLGVDYYKLPTNFLPNIRKSNIDRMLDNGFINGGKDILNNFMEELNVREDDMMYGEIDPETGQLKKTIPRFFINPFKNKNKNIIIGEKSYDLTRSLIIFSKMAHNYEQMNKIEGTVLALRDFLVEKGEQLIKRGDKALVDDLVGTELSSKIKGKDIEKIFQSFIDLYLYGVQVNPISDNSSGKYEKLILEAKQYFSLKSLGLGFIPALGGFLAAKTQAAIEGYKGQIYTSEHYRNAVKASYAERPKFHAISAFFDTMGVHYEFFSIDGSDKRTGLGDPRERNKIKKYVNPRLLMRPFSAGDELLDETILVAMAQNYYLDENNVLRRMRNDEERKNLANKSIWALFNYDGENGKLGKLSEAETKEVIIKFRRAAQGAQSRIKGTIPEEDKAYWQTQLLGNVIMQFKSWMPGVLRERFGKAKYNDSLMLVEMGRLTAFGQELHTDDQLGILEYMTSIVIPKVVQLGKHIMWYSGPKNSPRIKLAYESWLNNNPQYRGVIPFEEFLDAQQKQMKALILELRIILAFATLVALMLSDFDDDGKKFYQEMWATRKLAAVLMKVQQEVSFAYNPLEFANMIKNPVPLAGVLVDAVKILANGYDESVDLVFGEKAPLPFHKPQKEDKTPFGFYGSRLIPGATQSFKFLEMFGANNQQSQ